MHAFRKALTLFDDYYEMLSDDVRMQAYATAIELARAEAEKNGFADKVTFRRQNSLECQLDEKADLLLSETLGSFAVDENTLLFTLHARKRFLKPSGRLLPSSLRLFVAPVDCLSAHVRTQFWQEVFGIDYSPAMHEVLSRMSLADVDKNMCLARPTLYAELDLASFDEPSLVERCASPSIDAAPYMASPAGSKPASAKASYWTRHPAPPRPTGARPSFPFGSRSPSSPVTASTSSCA